jgi:hypothetical protein
MAGSNIYAQISTINNNEKEIKLSGDYIWAEYPALDRQKAIDGARREVSQKISTTIFSRSTQNIREQSGSVQDDFSASTSAISMLTLQGLDFLPKQKRDGSYDVLAYISKADLEASFDEEKRRQLESWRSLRRKMGITKVANESVGEVYRNYIETYLYPYAIYGELNDDTSSMDSVNIAIRYEELLESYLSEIEVAIDDIKALRVDDETILDVSLTLKRNEPITNYVQIRPDFTDYPFQNVRGGNVNFMLDRLPSGTEFDLPMELRVFNDDLNEDLLQLATDVSPKMILQQSIDVSKVVGVGITVQKIGQTGYSFFPRLQALNVESLSWELNGEEVATQPTYSLLVSEVSEGDKLSLILNDNQTLSHNLQYSSGQWLEPIQQRDVIASASTPTKAPTSTDPVESMRFDAAPIIDDLKTIRNGVLLVNRLNQLSSRGLIQFGNQRNVPSQKASYVVIINPNSRSVEDILSPETNQVRIGLLSDTSFSDYKTKYRGYGSIFIYVK